jgi:mono/diheme cytochrome c family protein
MQLGNFHEKRPPSYACRLFNRAWLLTSLLLGTAAAGGTRTLDWDDTEKTHNARLGETTAVFEFRATNNTREMIELLAAVPSCGCTVVQLPARPWVLPPGDSGVLKAEIDFTGKHGELEKTVEVQTTAGTETLRLRVMIPPDVAADGRVGNEQIARADRQAVFRNACASCHVPANPGLDAAALFHATCAICHESPHRASMVPDLGVRGAGRDGKYWRGWIEAGREGSLMPAFAMKNHGILSPVQVEQLVSYLVKRYGDPRQKP